MTGQPEGGDAVAALTQSRDASAAEALAMFRAQVKAFQRRFARTNRFRIGRVAIWLLAPIMLAILYMGPKMDWVTDLPPFASPAIAVLLGVAGLYLWRYGYYENCAELYRDSCKANRQFRIRHDCLDVTETTGAVQLIPWRAITDIVPHNDLLMIYLSPFNAICLPKTAHEGQDVEGFCAELQRRWAAHRGEPAP